MLPLVIAVVVAAHGLALQWIRSHVALSTTLVFGLIALIVLNHLVPASVLLRKFLRRTPE